MHPVEAVDDHGVNHCGENPRKEVPWLHLNFQGDDNDDEMMVVVVSMIMLVMMVMT